MPSIIFLRQFDYDISSVSEKHPGISDHKVIDKAKKEDRIILTFDKDYGEIIFKHATDNPPVLSEVCAGESVSEGLLSTHNANARAQALPADLSAETLV